MYERGLDLWTMDVSHRQHVLVLGSVIDSGLATNLFIQKGGGMRWTKVEVGVGQVREVGVDHQIEIKFK